MTTKEIQRQYLQQQMDLQHQQQILAAQGASIQQLQQAHELQLRLAQQNMATLQ